MLSVFAEVILPVVVMASVGGVIGRWRQVVAEPISTLVFYVLSPALIFRSMAETDLDPALSVRIVAAAWLLFFCAWGVSALWSSLVRHDARQRAAFALSVTALNAGNMGLPIALLAFGDRGLQIAVLFLVANAALNSTANVFIASLAGASARHALTAPLRYPMLYATLAGLLVNATGTELPIALDTPIDAFADAAIPTMLVVLGLQLVRGVERSALRDVTASAALRLGGGPLLMWGVTLVIGIGGATQQTLIVLAAMPTAVFTTILATEFSARPRFVTLTVISSTFASVASLTLLITALQG
ncbi:MAG: AEC family transporter [Chloroflexi bacterium]|nr:AEC family transporter [Chloroflexota bacterium]